MVVEMPNNLVTMLRQLHDFSKREDRCTKSRKNMRIKRKSARPWTSNLEIKRKSSEIRTCKFKRVWFNSPCFYKKTIVRRTKLMSKSKSRKNYWSKRNMRLKERISNWKFCKRSQKELIWNASLSWSMSITWNTFRRHFPMSLTILEAFWTDTNYW